MAQLVKHPTPDFSSGHDFQGHRIVPSIGLGLWMLLMTMMMISYEGKKAMCLLASQVSKVFVKKKWSTKILP